MDMQNVKNLTIPEGGVKTIHDKDNRLLWGAVGYNTTYRGDTFQQTYSGKNLALVTAANGYNITAILSDGEVNINGAMSAAGNVSMPLTTVLKANTAYILSVIGTGTVSGSGYKTIYFNYGDGSKTVGVVSTNTTRTYTFTPTSDISSATLSFDLANGTSFIDYNVKVQIESGNQATSFEPFVGGIPSPNPDYPQDIQVATGGQTVTISDGVDSQSYEINLGGEEFNESSIYSGHYVTQNGSIVADAGWCMSDYMPVDAGRSYTYSGITLPGNAPYSAYYDKNKTFISSFKQATGTNTITAPNNAEYVRFSLRDTSPNVDKDTFSFKLDGAEIELCKIRDSQDYIYKSGDDWYVHKDIGKITLNGSETWGSQAYGGHTYVAGSATVSNLSNAADVVTTISTQFTSVAWNDRTQNIPNSMYVNLATSTDPRIEVRNTSFSTVSELETWLSNNNATTYYVLKTPTDTQITDATLIGQLNAVHEWLTRYGYNATVSGNLPLIVDRTNL